MDSNGGYAIEFEGQAFTPAGKAPLNDVEGHNKALEAAELAKWAEQPERWYVYVTATGGNNRPATGSIQRGDKVTTWLGTPLGTIVYARTFHHNFGSRMTSIRFKGTNGAEYAGRFGSDWSQLCRVRKVKGGAR